MQFGDGDIPCHGRIRYLLGYNDIAMEVKVVTLGPYLCTTKRIELNIRLLQPGCRVIQAFNTLRPRQNGHHFPDDLYKCIFLNENEWISINISLKIVPKCPIDNIPALVQIMAWHRVSDKPLSEPMIARLPTHNCVTRPQRVNFTHLRHRFDTNKLEAYYLPIYKVICVLLSVICL